MKVLYHHLRSDRIKVGLYVDPRIVDQAVQAVLLHQLAHLLHTLLYALLVLHI